MIRALGAMVRVLMAVLTLLAVPSAARAQSCTTATGGNASCVVDATIPANIGKVTQLEITNTSAFQLGTVDINAFTSGSWDGPGSITITARANVPWGATIAATSGSFASPCAAKSASTLLWGRTSGTRTTPIGTTPAPVFASTSNPASAGTSQLLFLRLQVGWTTDPPRSCGLPLELTINAP